MLISKLYSLKPFVDLHSIGHILTAIEIKFLVKDLNV